MSDNRRPWSPMRIWTVSAASLVTAGLLGTLLAQQTYTGRVSGHPITWVVGGVSAVLWVAFLAAFVRDEVVAILKPLVRRIDNVEADVDELGDPHEEQDEVPAEPTRVIRQRGTRRLHPVE